VLGAELTPVHVDGALVRFAVGLTPLRFGKEAGVLGQQRVGLEVFTWGQGQLR